MLYTVFVQVKNKDTRNYVLTEFEESKDKFVEIISKRYGGKDGKYGKKASLFEKYSIINQIVRKRNVEDLSGLRLFVGNKAFCDGVFLKDRWNENAMQGGISKHKMEMLKFLLNISEIKAECKNNKDELHGIIVVLCEHFDESIAKYMIQELQITKIIINELVEYKLFDATNILPLL